MKRIKNFGSLTVEQQFDMLKSHLRKEDILLFQYYDRGNEFTQCDEIIDEYFELYCEELIYYYNPKLKTKIDEEVISILMKSLDNEKKATTDIRQSGCEVFKQMKNGNYEQIPIKTLGVIKKSVYINLMKYNYDEKFYNFVVKRMYGRSKWILDEQGKIPDSDGVIWYQPLDRNEYIDVIRRFQLFSCIVVEKGADINDFSFGCVVQEMADNYDLLIFSGGSLE